MHNTKPIIDFILAVCDLARKKNIKIVCRDKEFSWQQTRFVLLRLLGSVDSRRKVVNELRGIVEGINFHSDLVEFARFFQKKNRLKRIIDSRTYDYLNLISSAILLKEEKNGLLFDREDYLFAQYNNYFKLFPKTKAIFIYGLMHSVKDTSFAHVSFRSGAPLAARLMHDEASKIKGGVYSCASVYFFENFEETVLTNSLFSRAELKELNKMSDNDTDIVPVGNAKVGNAFDFVLLIKNCSKLFDHAYRFQN